MTLDQPYCNWCLRDIAPGTLSRVRRKNKVYRYYRKVRGMIVCAICYDYHNDRRKRAGAPRARQTIAEEIRLKRGDWEKRLS